MKMCPLLDRKKEARPTKPRLQGVSLRIVTVGTWDGDARPQPHSFTSSLDDQH